MNYDPMIKAAITEFKQKMTSFCENEDMEMLSPELAERTASAFMGALAAAGAAGYAIFLQAYETQADVVAANGESFRFKCVSPKTFLTPFGKMSLERRLYQNKSDSGSYIPLDEAWGMEGQYMAPQVRDAVLFSCAHITPEETARLLKKSAMFTPHPTAIKNVVRDTGAAIEAQREALDQAVRDEERIPEATKALAVSIDGATVLLNEKGASAGRPSERPRSGDKKQGASAYRIAMVGSVSCYGAPKDGQKTPQRLSSHYAAQMPEEHWPTAKARIEAEVAHAEAQCPEDAARILLMDGARNLWNYVETSPRFEHYHKLVDYWHTVEHLSLAAEAIFGKGSDAARAWYDKYRKLLLESDEAARKVQRSMDYYEKKRRLRPNRRRDLEKQRAFFRNNSQRMHYAKFRQNGWPIGSGPVEAACKTLVKTRLCRSGMRWSRDGGQDILTLRTYVKSNRWDAAWDHIKELPAAA